MHVKKFSEKAQNICDRELPVNRRHHTVKHVITAAIQATCNIIHHCFTLRRRFRNRLYLLPLCWNNQQVVSKHTAPLQDPKWNCFQQYPLPQVREKSVALSKPEEASRYQKKQNHPQTGWPCFCFCFGFWFFIFIKGRTVLAFILKIISGISK